MLRCAREGFTDEILFEDQVDESQLSQRDRILCAFEQTLQSPEFMDDQDEFADRNCEVFNPEGDLAPQCMKIYREYVAMVEARLVSAAKKVNPNFQFGQLASILSGREQQANFVYSDVYEVLRAAVDFNEFRAFMASFKRGAELDLAITATQLAY